MSSDRLIDLESERQRRTAIFSRDQRLGAIANRIQERLDLKPQRLALLDRNFLE